MKPCKRGEARRLYANALKNFRGKNLSAPSIDWEMEREREREREGQREEERAERARDKLKKSIQILRRLTESVP